jgi:hypothetical protein
LQGLCLVSNIVTYLKHLVGIISSSLDDKTLMWFTLKITQKSNGWHTNQKHSNQIALNFFFSSPFIPQWSFFFSFFHFFYWTAFISCSDSRLQHSIPISRKECLYWKETIKTLVFVLDMFFYEFYTYIADGILGIFIGFMWPSLHSWWTHRISLYFNHIPQSNWFSFDFRGDQLLCILITQ